MFKVGDAVRIKDSYGGWSVDVLQRGVQMSNPSGFVSGVSGGRYVTFYSPEWDANKVGHGGFGDEFYVSRCGHWNISIDNLEWDKPLNIEEFL